MRLNIEYSIHTPGIQFIALDTTELSTSTSRMFSEGPVQLYVELLVAIDLNVIVLGHLPPSVGRLISHVRAWHRTKPSAHLDVPVELSQVTKNASSCW